MDSTTRRWVNRLGAALIVLALIGLSITAYIVRDEGWDGLWQRKRQWIDGAHPALSPALDKIEDSVKKS